MEDLPQLSVSRKSKSTAQQNTPALQANVYLGEG